MFKRIVIAFICLLCCSATNLDAQDFVFLQFDLAPLHLNPSSAGDFDGKYASVQYTETNGDLYLAIKPINRPHWA